MIKLLMHRDLKVFLVGSIFSIIANGLFYINNTARQIGKMQTAICYYFPYILTMFFITILVLTVGLLRGKMALREWGRDQAKDILEKEKNIFKKILARTFLIVNEPALFTCGFAVGSLFFGTLITNPMNILFVIAVVIVFEFFSNKYLKKNRS